MAARKPKDRVGTCWRCGGRFKVRQDAKGVWVVGLHGFDRLGDGGPVERACPGSKRPPIEHSPEVLVEFLERERARLPKLVSDLAALEAGPPTLNIGRTIEGRWVVGDVGPDDVHYGPALAKETRQMRSIVRSRRDEIERLEREVSGWTWKPIPGIDTPSFEG